VPPGVRAFEFVTYAQGSECDRLHCSTGCLAEDSCDYSAINGARDGVHETKTTNRGQVGSGQVDTPKPITKQRSDDHDDDPEPDSERQPTVMMAFNWANPLEGKAVPGLNTAFLVSLVAATVLTLVAIPYGKRRPRGTPFSWGEAMLGSTYAFGVMFLAFGIVPHQWIDHADKNLGWDRTYLIYGPGGILKPQTAGGWNPITLQYQAVRDVAVSYTHLRAHET